MCSLRLLVDVIKECKLIEHHSANQDLNQFYLKKSQGKEIQDVEVYQRRSNYKIYLIFTKIGETSRDSTQFTFLDNIFNEKAY